MTVDHRALITERRLQNVGANRVKPKRLVTSDINDTN